MNDLISKAKLLEWIETEADKRFPGDVYGYADGRTSILDSLERELDSGSFSADPEPTPSLQPGDKVKHVDECWAEYGIGVVKELSKTGKSARISWPNYDRRRFIFGQPGDSNILLRKLRKVESSHE